MRYVTFSCVWLTCSRNQERRASKVNPGPDEPLPHMISQKKTYMPHPIFNRSHLKLKPLSERQHDMTWRIVR